MFVVVGTAPNLQSPQSLLDADVRIGTMAGLVSIEGMTCRVVRVTLAVEAWRTSPL